MTDSIYFTPLQWRQQFKTNLIELCKLLEMSDDEKSFELSLAEWLLSLEITSLHTEKQKEAALVIKQMLQHSQAPYMEGSEEVELDIQPFQMLWHGFQQDTDTYHSDFYHEMYQLFLQLLGKDVSFNLVDVQDQMNRWPSALDAEVREIQEANKERIVAALVEDIKKLSLSESKGRFRFAEEWTQQECVENVHLWWDDYRFHLAMAIKDPQKLNKYLDYTLSSEVVARLDAAKEKGIPFFVTPYYLSLLNTTGSGYDDSSVRDYVLYSQELIDNFGSIKAWEREDSVAEGQANAAGWLLPNSHSVHRRYPEVAILIPSTMGRACGGLCASCQRMYGFQKGNLNFDLEALKPRKDWVSALRDSLHYFEGDSQLRDILITGGDAFMSQNKTLKILLDEVVEMAKRKTIANLDRDAGEKYASIERLRFGSRLPAYLPSRINEELIDILHNFKMQARKEGVSQFVVQTHFQSPLEVTPAAAQAVKMLVEAGWVVVNQLVYTLPASRRGHTARLRQVLNQIGVICYYTFSVKGFDENKALFVPNARSVQEQKEEKILGELSEALTQELEAILYSDQDKIGNINRFMQSHDLPFMATDRSVMNLPGIGKSMSFQMIGIDAKGRRILAFSHDHTRKHSPIIKDIPAVYIRERKSIGEYLRELDARGENIEEYQTIWSYRIAQTESRFKFYEYPPLSKDVTKKVTNLGEFE